MSEVAYMVHRQKMLHTPVLKLISPNAVLDYTGMRNNHTVVLDDRFGKKHSGSQIAACLSLNYTRASSQGTAH